MSRLFVFRPILAPCSQAYSKKSPNQSPISPSSSREWKQPQIPSHYQLVAPQIPWRRLHLLKSIASFNLSIAIQLYSSGRRPPNRRLSLEHRRPCPSRRRHCSSHSCRPILLQLRPLPIQVPRYETPLPVLSILVSFPGCVHGRISSRGKCFSCCSLDLCVCSFSAHLVLCFVWKAVGLAWIRHSAAPPHQINRVSSLLAGRYLWYVHTKWFL